MTDPADSGGATYDAWQITGGVTSDGFGATWNGYNIVDPDLVPGKRHFYRCRVANNQGWSPWSKVSSVVAIAGARVKYNGAWETAVPYVRVNGVWRVARPWIKIAGVWKETG